jgi:hypothetical protein
LVCTFEVVVNSSSSSLTCNAANGFICD